MIYDTTSSRSSAENRNERKSRYIPLPVFPRMDDVYRQYSGVAVSFTISMVLFFVFVAFSADSLWLCDFTSNIMAAGMEEMTETNNRARISPGLNGQVQLPLALLGLLIGWEVGAPHGDTSLRVLADLCQGLL